MRKPRFYCGFFLSRISLVASLCAHTAIIFVVVTTLVSGSAHASPVTRESFTPPSWAVHAHEALQHYKTLVDYWLGHVSADDDDYFDVEGGWNDDVELAQSLTGYWFRTGDARLRAMLIDMARKNREARYTGNKPRPPWMQAGDTRFVQGYHSQLVDVHHSSEEVTLIYPRLFLIDYGNPENIELMTRMIWNFEDNVGNGERNWGQRVKTGMLMRSPRFNGRYLDWQWPEDMGGKFEPQDVAQNFRATAPGLSLAWYFDAQHYFWREGANGFLKNHHDAWIAASKSSAGGKPAYIPPSKIMLHDLGFGGARGWLHNDDLDDTGWGNDRADSFRHFYHAMTADWVLFKNNPDAQHFAQQANRIAQEAYRYRQQGIRIGGYTIDVDRALLQWRAETDASPHDDGLLRRRTKSPDTRMTAYNIFLQRNEPRRARVEVAHALKAINTLLQQKVKSGEWTHKLKTTDPNCQWKHDCLTDQVKLPETDAWLMAAVGGSGIYDGAYPTVYFSWKDTDTDIVSLVTAKHSRRLQFRAWNFGMEKEVGLRLWRLQEGVGELLVGPDQNRDGIMDSVSHRKMISISKGSEVRLPLASKRGQLVEIKVHKPTLRNPGKLPDIAASPNDITIEAGKISLRVHNIGLVRSGSFLVRLLDTNGKRIDKDKQLSLDGFTGMHPVTKTVHWTVASPRQAGSIVLDPEGKLEEITKLNNKVLLQ